jgi:hypothetical protein
MSLQEQFDIITKEQSCKDEMGKSCTTFEYYFTLIMQSEFHNVSFEESETFLHNFANLIAHEELQEQGLIFLCNQLWMSSRYFYEFKDEFINIFNNFLQLVKKKFTLSLIFKSLPYKWGGDETNNMINELLSKPKVNTNNDTWFMDMDEDIYGSFDAFVELKDYITIDLNNYYSHIYIGKCNNTIDY